MDNNRTGMNVVTEAERRSRLLLLREGVKPLPPVFTAQFVERGRRFYPVNEKARACCQLYGMQAMPEYKLDDVRALGFNVEVKG